MNKTPSQYLQVAVDQYNAVEDGHAEYAPSSAKRWCNCSASVQMSKDADDSANMYTAEGSLAHEICALTILNDSITPQNLEELVGDTYMIDDFEIEVTEEMIEAVMVYVNTIVRDMKELGLTYENYASCMSVEKRVTITEDCNGTSDLYLAVPFSKLVVYDFKYGAGVPVDVDDNYQMKCYAVGAMLDYEQGADSYMDVVELVIIQPRARHKDGTVRRWETTRDKILEFKVEIENCIEKCKKEDVSFKDGDWCRWCPGKHKCPELFGETNSIAKTAFDVVETGNDTLLAITDKQIIQMLDKKGTIEGFLKSIYNHALGKLKEGETLEGYKLVRGRATRSWYDAEAVEAKFEDQLDGDTLFTKKFISPAQMETELKKAGICATKKEAVEMIVSMVNPGEGKISLAPAHDKRQGLVLNAGDYFDDENDLDL